MKTIISLMQGTKLLSPNDKHRIVNAYNFSYSVINFEDVISGQGLTDDFQKIVSVLDNFVMTDKDEKFV